MSVKEESAEMYQTISNCSLCGRKVWKGYFRMVPDSIQSMKIEIICWRCKLFGKKG